jgi:hypothetical protein
MSSLAQGLRAHRDEITGYLYMGYAVWDDLVARVERQEGKDSSDYDDEQVWTFLVGCGYAIAGEDGVARLTEALTGSNQKSPANPKIWFEVLPVSPRKREGETHLDLALGTIAVRAGTGAGIKLDDVESPWVCFCEMKWYADIAVSVAYDVHRNQLARVIESALCFQDCGRYADQVYVALVTPASFRAARLKSRLYQYKFEEYNANPASLMADLEACILAKNEQVGWSYPPDLAQRVASLSLRWATYDELFENLPHSAIAAELKDFWSQHGRYQGRP